MARDEQDERQMQAMVALVEAQAQQLDVLRRAVDSLEARVAVRSELDMVVAQELRSPLEVLCETLEELQSMNVGGTSDQQRVKTLLTSASQHSENLSKVVDDMLRPWRATGPIIDRTRLEVLDLDDIMSDALVELGNHPSFEKIALNVEEGLTARTSRPRLTAIIVNLLDNALNYCQGGLVECEGWKTTKDVLNIAVTCDGSAKPMGTQGAFSPFDPSSSELQPGRGVGLYVVRMLARSLGGDITFSSDSDGRQTVQVELPQRRMADSDAKIDTEGESAIQLK